MTPKEEKAKQLPSSPGVYLMKDSYGSIIYVGKSKNLKNRVSSYFQQSSTHSNKVIKLVQHLKDFDIIQTDTEFEAFILECKLTIRSGPARRSSAGRSRSTARVRRSSACEQNLRFKTRSQLRVAIILAQFPNAAHSCNRDRASELWPSSRTPRMSRWICASSVL